MIEIWGSEGRVDFEFGRFLWEAFGLEQGEAG
jgi:hypothetical protein